MPVKDGPACPGCGLSNYSGLCPHCRGDQDAYEAELVPPFETSLPTDPTSPSQRDAPARENLQIPKNRTTKGVETDG